MWIKISEKLPTEGKEVLFRLVNSKKKVFGHIRYFYEYHSGKYVPNVALKSVSSISDSSYEIREIDIVTHWMDIPEDSPEEGKKDSPEETIGRFELMDI